MKFKYLLFCICFISIFNSCSQKENGTNSKPNILLILTDDQGWGDLGINGNPVLETPNLDALGKSSIRFDRFYVSPLCAPTRASILTGRYHLRTGTSWVTHRNEVMRSSEKTIAEYLKDAGYVTGCFGKWHNGEQYPNDPIGQGFDEFFGFKAGHLNNYFNTTLIHNEEPVKTTGYITDILADKAIGFIKEHKEGPFFCYVPFNAPHSPFQVPDKYFEKYKAKGLDDKDASVYGMVENLDDNIERILMTLDSLKLSDNTIVIYLTDNGPNGVRYNGGMKGIKGHVDEGGIRVPFFIRWPGHLPEGELIKQHASHVDILPTLLDLCGIKYTPVNPLDGRSLVPLLKNTGKSWQDESIYSIQNNGEDTYLISSLRTDQYMFVLDHKDNAHLYDMIKDPGQKDDILGGNKSLGDSLHTALLNWYADVTKNGIVPPPVPAGYDQSPLTDLPAPEAKFGGGLQWKGKMGWAHDWIVNFKNKDDQATWTVTIDRPDTFEVLLKFAAGAASKGKKLIVQYSKGSLEYIIPGEVDAPYIKSPDRVERGEVYQREWPVLSLGDIVLDKGVQEISLAPVSELNDTTLAVKSVYLKLKDPE